MSETNPSYQSQSVDALTDPNFVVDPNTATPIHDQTLQDLASQRYAEFKIAEASQHAQTVAAEVEVRPQPETKNETINKIFVNAFLVKRARDEVTGIADIDFPKVNLN